MFCKKLMTHAIDITVRSLKPRYQCRRAPVGSPMRLDEHTLVINYSGRKILLLMCINFTIWTMQALPCKGQTNTPSIADVIAQMKRFSDLFVEQRCWLVDYVETRDLLSLPVGAMSEWPTTEYINAQKGSLLYAYRKVDSKPVIEHWVGWKDSVCTRRILERNYEILPEVSTDFFELWKYTHNLFIDTHKGQTFQAPAIVSSFGSASLSEALWPALPRSVERKLSEWKIRPTQENVDGFPCAVLVRTTGGFEKDVIWIDLAHGGVCRKRRYNQTSEVPFLEWKNEQVVEKSSGLWLPMEQTVNVYNDNSVTPENVRHKLRYVQHIKVKKFSLEMLPDEFFIAPIIKEGVVMDSVRGISYMVDQSNSKPESRIGRAIEDAAKLSHVGKFGQSTTRITFLLINLAAILVVLLLLQRRWLSKTRTNRQ
jgi:hypothetical protein